MNESPATRAKAIVLYSGGLDSLLAVEVLLRAGVGVVALRHHSIFYPPRPHSGYVPRCEVVARDITEKMLDLVRDPQYGFGKNANPCLDCKQMMYGLAWDEARRRGTHFIATGEVLGQRPMSQRADAFRRMEKGAGIEGLVLRPLSAKLLPPTIPEQQGLLRREDMLDISGRGRKRQMQLAEEWGITDYPTPAGGCRLTDPNYADRLFRLRALGHLNGAALRAARHGRLFELGERAFVLVGRNREDNEALLADAPDGALLLELKDNPGPLACLVGPASAEELDEARALVIRHSRLKGAPLDAVGVTPVDQMRAAAGRAPS